MARGVGWGVGVRVCVLLCVRARCHCACGKNELICFPHRRLIPSPLMLVLCVCPIGVDRLGLNVRCSFLLLLSRRRPTHTKRNTHSAINAARHNTPRDRTSINATNPAWITI